MIDDATEQLAREVVDSAIKVHRSLGPGLLESAYEHCLARELEKRGVGVERQRQLPVIYDGERIDAGYRLDLVIERCVIIEVKSVDRLAPIHEAQLLTYLRLSGLHLGFLLNFNSVRMIDGLKRFVA